MSFRSYLSIFFLVGAITGSYAKERSSDDSRVLVTDFEVKWTDLVDVTESNGSLTKTSSTATFNFGGVSSNILPAHTDGWIEFTLNDVSSNAGYMVGFTTNSRVTNTTFSYAIRIAGGSAYNYEGSQNGKIATNSIGTVYRISREGNVVTYYRDGSPVKTSAADPSQELRVKMAILYTTPTPVIRASFNSQLFFDVDIHGTSHSSATGSIALDIKGGKEPYSFAWSSGETTSSITGKPAGAYAVTVTDVAGRTATRTFNLGYKINWINLENVSIEEEAVVKTGGSAWDAGAVSSNVLPANTDGRLEFILQERTVFEVGFALNQTMHPEAFTNGIYFVSGGTIYAYETRFSTSPGNWFIGDTFTLERVGSEVRYLRNGSVFRTISVNPDLDLRIKMAVHTSGVVPVVTSSFEARIVPEIMVTGTDKNGQGGSIHVNAKGGVAPYSYNWPSGEAGASIVNKPIGTYTVTITDAEGRTIQRPISIGYRNRPAVVNGGTEQDFVLTKNVATSWANSGMISSNTLLPNTDGWVEFIPRVDDAQVTGFSVRYENNTTDFLHGVFTTNGYYYINEGNVKVVEGMFHEGDVFKIAREGSTVRYYLNGVHIRSAPTTASFDLKCKTILYTTGTSSPVITTSFDSRLIPSAVITGTETNTGSISLSAVGGTLPYTYSWTKDQAPVIIGTGTSLTDLSHGTYHVTITDADGRTCSRSYAVGFGPYWSFFDNTFENNGALTKTTGAGWDAGANGSTRLPVNTDGWIEFVCTTPRTRFLFGLGTSSTIHLNHFLHGIRLDLGIVYYREGTAGTVLGSYTEGDVFRLSREGDVIKYYQNGVVLRTVNVSANKAPFIKALIYNGGYTPLVNSSFGISPAEGNIPDAIEFNALKDLYDNTDGANWAIKTNWPTNWTTPATTEQMATWSGVTVVNGDITELVLPSNNLVGTIPASFTQLNGLVRLDLSGNQITGDIPDLSSLTNLSTLLLNGNNFTAGPIPTWLTNHTALTSLDLSATSRKGSIPATIAALTNLQDLKLSNNQLMGEIPSDIGALVNLQQLALGHNQLDNVIPSSITSLTNLTSLSLDHNNLLGGIPSTIGNLTQLQTLKLNDNAFYGSLPESMSALVNLHELSLHHNNLDGTIPASFGGFSNLTTLSLHDNDFSAMGDFSQAANRANLTISVESNNLAFSDLEQNFTGPGVHVFQQFTYAPQQAPTLPENLNVPLRGTMELHAINPGTHGSITWQKQETEGTTWTDVTAQNQGADASSFKLSNFQAANAGSYKYTQTNSWVTGLTFESSVASVTYYEPAQVAMNQWAFQYKYDNRGRLIKKKIPGADWIYMVYDDRDRLVLSQDGNQRAASPMEWTFTKYDALNRPVLTGIYKDTPGHDLADMQQVVDAFYIAAEANDDEWFEAPGTGVHGYTNQSFPKVADPNDYYTVTYFDDYGFKSHVNDQALDFSATELPAAGGLPGQVETASLFTVDQITGSKTKVTSDNTWLVTVTYYDDKQRVIQNVSQNHKGGIDRLTNVYDFAGKIMRSQTTHSYGEQNETNIASRFKYDHAGRLLNTWRKIDATPEVMISENVYNELGQLITKKLHSTESEPEFKQHVDYRYNIRGWLTRINNADLNTSDGGPKDFFGMEFGYQNDLGAGEFTPQYNGNISATKWSANFGLATDLPTERSYAFTYDGMNRFIEAKFSSKTTTWSPSEAFMESTAYDKNGNIYSLRRKDGFGRDIDMLSYEYGRGPFRSDRLLRVVDHAVAAGFKDGNKLSMDYFYDYNGNVVKDNNKGIDRISYNRYLDITEEIIQDGKRIKSTYNSQGIKLTQEVYEEGQAAPAKRTDYLGSLVFEDNVLKFVGHEEGKVIIPEEPLAAGEHLEYQYQIKDNLNNVRVSFTTKLKVDPFVATMEDNGDADISNPRVQELEFFGNLFESEVRDVNQWLNHTSDSSGIAIYLDGSSSRAIGPYSLLKVNPGEKIELKVYGKFENQVDYNNSLTAASIMAMLINPAAQTSSGEAASMAEGNFAEDLEALINGKGDDANVPHADLNYIFFDKDFNVIDFDYDRISTNAGFDGAHEYTVDFDELTLTKEIDRIGYLYVYVSNETPGSHVWMDDLTILRTRGPVIQAEDYYPFGLSMAETAFELDNDQYKGQLTTDGSGYKDIGFRQYDPAIGRFPAVDPMAEMQYENSTFQYAGNNPVSRVDILGLLADAWGDYMTGSQASAGMGIEDTHHMRQTRRVDQGAEKERKSKSKRADPKPKRKPNRFSQMVNHKKTKVQVGNGGKTQNRRATKSSKGSSLTKALGNAVDKGAKTVVKIVKAIGSESKATTVEEMIKRAVAFAAARPADPQPREYAHTPTQRELVRDDGFEEQSYQTASEIQIRSSDPGRSFDLKGIHSPLPDAAVYAMANPNERTRVALVTKYYMTPREANMLYYHARYAAVSDPMRVNVEARGNTPFASTTPKKEKEGEQDFRDLDKLLDEMNDANTDPNNPNPGKFEFDWTKYLLGDKDFSGEGEKKYIVLDLGPAESGTLNTAAPEVEVVKDPYVHVNVNFKDAETGEVKLSIQVPDVGTAERILEKIGYDDGGKQIQDAEDVAVKELRKELKEGEPDPDWVSVWIRTLVTEDNSKTPGEPKDSTPQPVVDETDCSHLDGLTPDERASIAKNQFDGMEMFDWSEEEIVIYVLKGTPDEDVEETYDKFMSTPTKLNGTTQPLANKVVNRNSDWNPYSSDENYRKTINTIVDKFRGALNNDPDFMPDNSDSEDAYLGKWHGTHSPNTGNTSVGTRTKWTSELQDDGSIIFREIEQVKVERPCGRAGAYTCGDWKDTDKILRTTRYDNPLQDMIIIEPQQGSRFYDPSKEGPIVVNPIALHFELDEDRNDEAKENIERTVDIGFLALGVGEVAAAVKGTQKILAVIEIGAASLNVAVTAVKDELESNGVMTSDQIANMKAGLSLTEASIGLLSIYKATPAIKDALRVKAISFFDFVSNNKGAFSALEDKGRYAVLRSIEGSRNLQDMSTTADAIDDMSTQAKNVLNEFDADMKVVDNLIQGDQNKNVVSIFNKIESETTQTQDVITELARITKNGDVETLEIVDKAIKNRVDDAMEAELANEMMSSPKMLKEMAKEPNLADAWNTLSHLPNDVSGDVDLLKLVSSDDHLKDMVNLYKNGHREKLYDSEMDEVLIYHYSKYSNEAREIGGEFYDLYRAKLDAALENLPSTLNNVNPTYGGYNFTPEMISRFLDGNLVDFGDLLSTSKSQSFANDVLKVKGGNVYIEVIDSYSGKAIQNLSSFPEEQEVLFTSETIFKVKGTPETIPHPNGKQGQTVLKVVLEQM